MLQDLENGLLLRKVHRGFPYRINGEEISVDKSLWRLQGFKQAHQARFIPDSNK